MAFCRNCGTKLIENSKYCQKCGCSAGTETTDYSKKQQELAGKIYKCPRCGEILQAFEINCPACGHELRGTKASSAIKEFALKLEAIESRREYEKPRGLFALIEAQQRVSKTDKQMISLIKSFSVPNSKEDMLEFMVLATSSMNMRTYDSSNTNISKSEKEINAAWFSKVQQVYEKAKRSYSTDSTFTEIKSLYDRCNEEIKKSKKKGIVKWILLLGWMPALFAVIFIWIGVYSPIEEKKEIARLDAIVDEIENQLEDGEYKYALMNADGLVYSGSIRNDEQSRKWQIKREYWIDRVIEEAAENDVILERPEEKTTEKSSDNEANTGESVEGFKEGLQPGLDTAKENIDEFNRIMNGEKTTDDQNKK